MADETAGSEGRKRSRLHAVLDAIGTGGASILTGGDPHSSRHDDVFAGEKAMRHPRVAAVLEAFATGGASILTGGAQHRAKQAAAASVDEEFCPHGERWNPNDPCDGEGDEEK
jgi:hypothetical protein